MGGAPQDQPEYCYFGGALEDVSAGFCSPLFLWCFFLWLEDFDASEVDDEAAGVEEAGAGLVDCANAGPAIRARAMTGTSFLNID